MSRAVRWSFALTFALLFTAGCPRPGESDLAEGNRAAQAGRYAEAQAAFARAAAADPKSARARALEGAMHLALEHRAQAAEAFTAARTLDPASEPALLGLARLASDAADAGAALEALAALPPATANGPGARLARARALLLRGTPQDGEAALSDALAARTAAAPGPEAGYLVGCAQLALGRFADAQATLDGVARDFPTNAAGPLGLARLAAAQGRGTDALLHLKAARTAGTGWAPTAVALDPAFAFLSNDPSFLELTRPSP